MIKEDMMKTFFTNKYEASKSESETSMTERIKERQNYKSKSIMDDPKYKDIINTNNNAIPNQKMNTPDNSLYNKYAKTNGRSTSSFNISNSNTNYNSYSINLNHNYNTSKLYIYKL